MELTLSLEEHLARSAMLHSCLCPRQVLGVRMARLACRLLSIDPALERKSIYVYMEIGRCAADAVIVVTGASPTNGLMRLMDYGKVAATFVSRSSGEAFRISERHDSRDLAVQRIPGLPAWEAQRGAYQIMPDDHLFHWQSVFLRDQPPVIAEKHSVTCQVCGDRINEHAEVMVEGQILCKACACGSYFVPTAINPRSKRVQPPDQQVYSR